MKGERGFALYTPDYNLQFKIKMTAIKNILLAACISVASAASAETWSLDSCVNYAIAHNINVQTRLLQEENGRLSVTEAKDRFLPTVNAYGSQSFSFGRGLTAENTYANRNTSSFSVGANLNLPIFQGLAGIRRLKYEKASLRALLEQTEAAKDDVTLNVITQYLQALYAGELLQVARERLNISTAELARRQALLEAGKTPELDIYEARSQVSQDELNLVNCTNDSVIALLDLAQLLNLPSAEGFAIEPLGDSEMPLLSPEEVWANACERNHTLRAGRFEAEAAEKNVALAKTGYIPTISFSAGLGTNYYKTSGFTNENFSQQMRHNFAKQLGFSISLPIFDAFGTRNSVRRANVQVHNARLQLDDSRQRIYKAIVQAYTQAKAAHAKRDAATVAVESSRAAFDAMKVKFDNGRATPTEYERTRSEYTNSLAESVQAKYEAILRARILLFYNR